MSSLRPVSGTPDEVLAALHAWDTASDPEPLVVETSGSTGRAKRVVLSRRAMRASADATAARLGGHGQWLLSLPATYVAGVQVLFRSVRAGTEPVLVADHLGFADAAASMGADRRYVSLVPTQLHRMLGSPVEVDALRSFTTVLLGGGPVDPALRACAASEGIRLVATYGMSETCGGCVYDGVPLDGVAVKIAADGEVLLAGPVLFEEYDGEPARTQEALVDGWFCTGDLGRLDADGRLVVLGRRDDMVVSGGINVPGAAVAARLREHPGVAAAEVVGVADPEWGNRVCAVLVPARPGPEDTGGSVARAGASAVPALPELRDWVAAVHPREWAPQTVVAVGGIPVLDNGKPDRETLRRIAEAAR